MPKYRMRESPNHPNIDVLGGGLWNIEVRLTVRVSFDGQRSGNYRKFVI